MKGRTMATCKNETERTVIVYDIDRQKTIEKGSTAVVYRDVTGSGLTILSDTPYYSPILESRIDQALVANTPLVIDAVQGTLSFVIYHIATTGIIMLHFNDVSTPGMSIKPGERLTIPCNTYIKKIVLVSTEAATCDILQLQDGATETTFMW